MCFLLYAGTNKPIPRRGWQQESPDISVRSLTEQDAPIRSHFSAPEVQYVGSTSGCGCDFPSLMYQNGDWPVWPPVETDEEKLGSDRHNRGLLIELLRSTDEAVVELYGVWEGDFAKDPRIHEDILLKDISRDDFYFKERMFYRVTIQEMTAEKQ